MPNALVVAEALSAIGAFSIKGINAVSAAWDEVDFQDDTSCHESDRLIQAMLERLIEEQLVTDAASDDHVGHLYGRWQMPLYALDMKAKAVERSALEAEQERMLWARWVSPTNIRVSGPAVPSPRMFRETRFPEVPPSYR